MVAVAIRDQDAIWDVEFAEVLPVSAIDNAEQYHAALIDIIARLHGDSDKPVLEAGSGTGTLMAAVARRGINVLGIDSNANALRISRELFELVGADNVAVLRGDLFKLRTSGFSVAYSQGVLEHYNDFDIQALVAEQLRVADHVVISVPSPQWNQSPDPNERHLLASDWMDILTPAFVVADVGYYSIGEQVYIVLHADEQLSDEERKRAIEAKRFRLKVVPMAVLQNHGYGRIGAYIPSVLAQAGAQLVDRTKDGWDLKILIGTLDTWFLDRFQPDLVFHTMWEADPLPDNWFPWINRCGAVWVPTTWVKEMMERSGVTRPIMVSGYGVDQTSSHYVEREREPDDPYTFLSWARMLVDRKKTLTAVQAFCEANLPNSRLLIKHNVMVGRDDGIEPWATLFPAARTQQFVGTYEDADGNEQPIENVTIISGNLSESQLLKLMQLSDAFVYPSGNEGFGLMVMEAMASGLPCICPATTGLRDFVTPEVARIVGTIEVDDTTYLARIWGRSCRVQEVILDDVVREMEWCYEHKEEARGLGRAAAKLVATEWTWERAGVRALEQLQAYHQTLSEDGSPAK